MRVLAVSFLLLLVSLGLASCDVFLSVDNHRPVADARAQPIGLELGQTVVLDGTASTDPDGDSLTFRWRFSLRPPGAVAEPADPDASTTELVPDRAGTWRVELIVNDGEVDSLPDEVRITVRYECEDGADCGPGAWTCEGTHCQCATDVCQDGHCLAQGECCQDVDCGSGAWSCEEGHACACAAAPCDDGHCPSGDQCCSDNDCLSGEVCFDHACAGVGLGTLVIDWTTCSLDGEPCPVDMIVGDGASWTLLEQGLMFTRVTISGGAILTAPAVDAGGNEGRLEVEAYGRILVGSGSTITMSGRGWGGGGGGSGLQYCEEGVVCAVTPGGGTGHPSPGGEQGHQGHVMECFTPGYDPEHPEAGAGGAGGGFGGEPGGNGRCGYGGVVGKTQEESDALCDLICPDPPLALGDGSGGAGGGPFGGAGGVDPGYANTCEYQQFCDDEPGPLETPAIPGPERAESGVRGGYNVLRGNGDDTTDDSVQRGSGGGGGAGGDTACGYCCGSASGGHGGAPGADGRPGCVGGGGGGGGGAGGGAIVLRARDISIQGTVCADGAGQAGLFGGYGAGGGILLHARESITIGEGAVIRTLGGFSDWQGSPVNGGTVKLFFRTVSGEFPGTDQAGRIFTSIP